MADLGRSIRKGLHAIAKFQLTILLFFLYCFVIMPFSIMQRITHRASLGSWEDFHLPHTTLSDLQSQ